MICELLGVPVEHRDRFRSWFDAIFGTPVAPLADEAGRAAADATYDFLCDLMAAKPGRPR